MSNPNTYIVTNSWGSSTGNPAGKWVLGNRQPKQYIVNLKISTSDEGRTYTGTMQYSGEGPIGVNATRIEGQTNMYAVTNSWGTSMGNPAGDWNIGSRAPTQYAINLDITGDSNGTLSGTMQYNNEGPIGFSGTLVK